MFAILFSLTVAAQWSRNIRLTSNTIFDDSAPTEAGVEKILVFKTLNGATLSYEAESGHTVRFYRYENSIADKVDIPSTSLGGVHTIENLQDNSGIVIEDDNQMRVIWIIDYSLHPSRLQSIEAIESADKCEALKLFVTNNSDDLEYRGTAGQLRSIKRRYTLSYSILKWDAQNYKFNKEVNAIPTTLTGTEIILTGNDLPNLNTEFTLSGDQFSQKFKQENSITSAEYRAVAVQAYIQPIQTPKNAINEGQEGIELGGSAPIDIDFYGYGNEPVAYYYIWSVYDKKDMDNPVARYTDKDFLYTFEQAGDYEVVLEVANGESSCVATASVSFGISDSEILVPNFFMPGNHASTNSEFKVYYRSIIKYHITIFNRWGNKVWESRDPAKAWDGRYGGRLINPGVYYYSIQATGSDDRKYNMGGDINVLR